MHQEIIKSAATETFYRWWAKWQRQNADALKEMQEKHGVQILRTPPDILIEFLKTWDIIAKEEAEKNPFFKKVLESQRAYAIDRRAGEARSCSRRTRSWRTTTSPRRARRRPRRHRRRRRSSGPDIARGLHLRLNAPRPVARAAGRLFGEARLHGEAFDA